MHINCTDSKNALDRPFFKPTAEHRQAPKVANNFVLVLIKFPKVGQTDMS